MGPIFYLKTNDLNGIDNKLSEFYGAFTQNFKTRTRSVVNQSKQYLQGQILENGRGNMVKYSKIVPNSDNQSLQHFISTSEWDEEGVIKGIQKQVTVLIGNKDEGSMHMDECTFPKQGNKSAGVKRQYCGRLGKVENCQVGVFLGYVNGNRRTLIDKRLYLPEDWINDSERRRLCGVPKDVEFKTKAELGLEMVLKAKERGVPFGWLGMDCHYGEQPWLLDELDEEVIYIADIPCNTRVWIKKPLIEIPQRKGIRGRQPVRECLSRGEPQPVEVRKIAEQSHPCQWHRILLRDTERKELWSQMAFLRVYPVRDKLPGKETWLIIRIDEGENIIKYQLSNAPADTPTEKLIKMSCSRFWIERALEDGKGEVGMGDYEVRGWLGWHHHMTMTLLAMLFLLTLAIEWGKKAPLLTVQDVREILEVILPKKKFSKKDVTDWIKRKHLARYSAKQSHHRRK